MSYLSKPYLSKKVTSSKFIEYSPYFCLGINIFLFLALLLSTVFSKTLVDKTISTQVVEGDNLIKLEPILFEKKLIGALRIDTQAIIQNNTWLTYEIQLQDSQGNIVASAMKPAWRESGTWSEDGESGTWSEADLLGGIDLRLSDNEKQRELTPVITILEYTDNRGNPLSQSNVNGEEIYQNVSFKVKIIDGAIDTRYIWAGIIGTCLMTIFCFYSVNSVGKLVISKFINDSDLGDWAVSGDPDKLVKATIKVLADETAPSSLNFKLWVNDGYGEQVCKTNQFVSISYRKDDEGEILSATAKTDFYFLFPKRASHNFYVEIEPDQPVEKTWLWVKEGVKTLNSVGMLEITKNEV
jgi:hypothetical protein